MADSSKDSFTKANPKSFEDLQGNSDAFKKLQAIERDTKQELEKAALYLKENRAGMLEEARKEIIEEKHPVLELNPPTGKSKSLDELAHDRVSLKAQGIMAAVNADRARKIEDVFTVARSTDVTRPAQEPVQATPKRAPAHPLKRETHQIAGRAQAIRIRSHKHFRNMREQFIRQASARGSDAPVRDVFRNNILRQKRIDRAENRLLDKAFKRHGIDCAPTQTQDRSGPDIQV